MSPKLRSLGKLQHHGTQNGELVDPVTNAATGFSLYLVS